MWSAQKSEVLYVAAPFLKSVFSAPSAWSAVRGVGFGKGLCGHGVHLLALKCRES